MFVNPPMGLKDIPLVCLPSGSSACSDADGLELHLRLNIGLYVKQM